MIIMNKCKVYEKERNVMVLGGKSEIGTGRKERESLGRIEKMMVVWDKRI